MRKTMLSYSLLVGVAILITGCASTARVDNMIIEAQPSQRIIKTPLRNNLAIRDVTGGKETNPLWKSNVGSSDLEQALEESLRSVGLLADRQSGRYMIIAHLNSLDQPSIGINFTVTASVSYTVVERATGKNIYDRTIVLPYTANFGDHLYGVARLRLANEGAIRVSITQLVGDLLSLKIEDIAIK